jgi:RNA polymerase sigma-70 factor (ECF subfamily)
LYKIDDTSSHKTKGFIVIIVRNTSKDILRKRNRLKEDVDDELYNTIDESASIPESLTSREGYQNIIKAVNSLPDILADVFLLHEIYSYTHKEIADILGIKEELSRKRLSRAKNEVRKQLEGEAHGK